MIWQIMKNIEKKEEEIKMDKKKFAFVMMGADHEPEKDRVCFEGEKMLSYVYTVRNFEEAKACVLKLKAEGVGVIELCGAFGKEKAKELIELTGNQMGIGYVVHEKEQDEVFGRFFGE